MRGGSAIVYGSQMPAQAARAMKAIKVWGRREGIKMAVSQNYLKECQNYLKEYSKTSRSLCSTLMQIHCLGNT